MGVDDYERRDLMFQYTRLDDLLTFFLTHTECISPQKLAKDFEISTRTLRNDIRNINESLTSNHLQILMKRGEGYYLDGDKAQIQTLLETLSAGKEDQLDSADKRINHLIMFMLYANEYQSMDDLADEVFVSTNTIMNYLKTIRLILKQYHLTLETRSNWGYRIAGEEVDKRHCIIDLITSHYHHYALTFSKEQKALLNNVDLDAIKQIVLAFNREHHVSFSDYNLKNMILHIALSISRLHISSAIMEYEIPYKDSLEELLSPMIAIIEEEFELTFTPEEKRYIYSHYISNTNDLLDPQRDSNYIHTLVDHIIDFIYESYHFDLRHDLILEKDLCHHLQSILNAKCYSLNKRNPLINTIKRNYILSFEVTETAIKEVFAQEPFTLTEDEIGYISLHIGAAIERYFDAKQMHIKKAIIVYDSGYAVGNFIKAKLSTIFKDKLDITRIIPSNEVSTCDMNRIDFIISTLVLKDVTLPTVVVELPLLRKDIEIITNQITLENMHPIDKITHFFDDDLFFHTSAASKEDIIHTLCEALRHKGYANEVFEASVLEREHKISTVMDGVVATPHPLLICTSTSKIAVAILDEPVVWSDKDHAQIILMMGLADDSKKDIEKLYDTFVFLMNNPPLQSLLFKAHSLQEFLGILKANIDSSEY